MTGFYSFNENNADCREPSHRGVEVIFWPEGGWVNDVEVMAVCRDEDTASLLCDALNAKQVDGQTSLDVEGQTSLDVAS